MDTLTIIDEDAPIRFSLGGNHEAEFDPKTGRTYPVIRGAGDAPIAHPLGPPVVTGDTITVDTMLNQPTRVTRYLMDITKQRFFADRLFSTPGGVTGGAVIYDTLAENELYLDRDVQRIMPGGEFPIVNSSRRAPSVAEVEKWGGKFFTTYEARDRNDQIVFRRHLTKLGNTLIRKHNQRAVEAVDAAIAALGGAGTFVGNDWSAYIPNGNAPTLPAGTPMADFAKAQLLADQRELGITYDGVAVNPTQLMELRLGYGNGLSAALRDNGINEIYATNRIAVGTAYIYASNDVGQIRNEQPLASKTWDEPETERVWTQSGVRSVMFVDNPYAVLKVTGL